MIILPEDKNIMELLSANDAQQVLLALFSESDDMPALSPLANMAYTAIKSKSDRITERKSRAGISGGAPQNNQNAKKQAEQAEQAEQAADEENKQNKQTRKKQAEQADEEKTTHRTSTVTSTTNDNTPLYPPRGEDRKSEIKKIWDSYTFSPELSRVVKDWGKYKQERREEYRPKGLQSLLSQVQENSKKYGEQSVISLIRESMAANYKGITWDKLHQRGGAPGKSSNLSGDTAYEVSTEELEALVYGMGGGP